jgi:uncharacterized protein (TIGR02466 family)
MTPEEKDAEIKRLTKQIQENAERNIIKEVPKRNITKEGQLFFGPYVALTKVHPTLVRGLVNRGDKLESGTANSSLAGHLADQRRYTMEDKEWFIKEFKPYVNWYVEGALEWSSVKYDEEKHLTSFTLMDLWINYMKQHEYNPQHFHGGQMSWVIFCKTPELSAEQKEYEGKSVPPGSITFQYGEPTHPKWADHTFEYKPQEHYMWMFPAQLRHQVMPFHTEGTRISVSGNLYFNQQGMPDDISDTPNGFNG